MIVDLSKWNGKIDWDLLAPALDFVILKATGGEIDPRFAENAAECNARGIPFHVYHFSYAKTEARAEEEAALFWETAHAYNPVSYILDVEGELLNLWNVLSISKAFISKLRALGAERIGIYTGDWAWKNLGFSADMADWVWIARYGANSGDVPATGPSEDADLWQYTSNGSAPGVSTRVDVSRLQGRKPMEYFTAGSDRSMAVIIGSARGDENGGATGGKAGDQTGREVSTQDWYKHSKGWLVFRPKSAGAAEKIAWDMQAACDNPHIGYDQNDRLTLYDAAKAVGFDCAKVETNCETDCSALVRVCCAYAGIDLPNFNTAGEPRILRESGAFDELTGTKYSDSPDYLRRGDILCTATQAHTAVVLTDGPKAYDTSDRTLKRGDKGEDVVEMQKLLLANGYSVGPDGADGDFGKNTEKAVKSFQMHHNLTADGVCGPATWKALRAAKKTYTVVIHGVDKEEMEAMKMRWPECEVTEE